MQAGGCPALPVLKTGEAVSLSPPAELLPHCATYGPAIRAQGHGAPDACRGTSERERGSDRVATTARVGGCCKNAETAWFWSGVAVLRDRSSRGGEAVSPQAVLAIRTTESSPKAKAGDGLSVTRKES